MKLFLATVATSLAVAAEAGALEKWENLRRRLSFEMVAGYKPGSQVTDHCAIDLDQAAIEAQLAIGTDESFARARKIYNQGGNSKSYAQITLNEPLSAPLSKGAVIMGKNDEDKEVAGKTGQAYNAGDTNVKVYYETTDIQSDYVNCQVGGLSEPNMKGCFKETGDFDIGGQQYSYTYIPATDNRADRTIAGFSTGAESKMLSGCPGCPYTDFKHFYDYYGKSDYAHQWVEAAFDGGSTSFSNGNADFSQYSKAGREQIIKKGTAYLNVFMYVMREFEDSMDDCKKDLVTDNYNSVHAWDEGVCFYTGSVEAQDGLSDDGKLLHQLADKRCEDFKTCGPEGVSTDGQSMVNYQLMDKFALGNEQILAKNCGAARDTTKDIMQLMYIPMIQGTLRYAYKVDKLSGGEKEKAEGAAFAAAVLPRVHAADSGAASKIYNNMRVGASNTNYAEVKQAFESVYSNLGITCADIGGLWNEATKDYYAGMEPCSDSSTAEVKSNGSSSMKVIVPSAVALLSAVAAFAL